MRRRRSAWFERKDLYVAIFDRKTQRILGEGGLGPDWDSLVYELGFWLRPSAEGHGYMTETNILMCEWAFTDLSAQRVVMSCDSDNLRSAAIAHRLGMKEVEATYIKEELRTVLSFEMTAEEYISAPWRKRPSR